MTRYGLIELPAQSEADQRAAVIAEARSWLGTPFRMGQASKGYGVDCGLFLAACYRAAGIDVPIEFGLFRHDWHLHTKEERYLEAVERYTRPVETPESGDLVLVRTHKNAPFSHGGIVLEWPLVIHAAFFHGSGRVGELDVSQGPAAYWETRFYSPWKIIPSSAPAPAHSTVDETQSCLRVED
jgi:cell wall-associated NlpC family hydrolase